MTDYLLMRQKNSYNWKKQKLIFCQYRAEIYAQAKHVEDH